MLAFLFCSLVPDYISTDSVDVIELNHVCAVNQNELGGWDITRNISQIIFWELAPSGEYRVRDWRMLKDCKKPTYDHTRGRWRCTWADRGLFLWEVSATSYIETFTLHDREIEDRKEWPLENRITFKRGQP